MSTWPEGIKYPYPLSTRPTSKKMRTPTSRRHTVESIDSIESIEPVEPVITAEPSEKSSAVSGFSVGKVISIFFMGVLVASSGLGLYLLNNDSVQVNKDFHGNTLAPIQILNTSGGMPSRLFVVHDVNAGDERIATVDITTGDVHVLSSVQQVADQHQMANPQVSTDGKIVFFCKIGKNGATNILAVSADGTGNSGYIAQNVGYCDYSVKRSLKHTSSNGIIYVPDDGHVYFVDYESDHTPVKLTEKVQIPEHTHYHSPVLQDDRLFYVDIDMKVYMIDLINDPKKRFLISDRISSVDTTLRISPDGRKLIIIDIKGFAEIISIDPKDKSFRMEVSGVSNAFISRSGNSLYVLTKDTENDTQYAINRIDLKYYKEHGTKKEAFLDVLDIDCTHGIDLLSSN